MKTNKFIKDVEAMGFEVSLTGRVITIRNSNKEEVAKTFTDRSYSFFNNYTGFINLSKYKQQQLFKLLTEYASTPILEREEEKKYMYHLKKIDGLKCNDEYYYFNYIHETKEYCLSDKMDTKYAKTKFTHSWLKERGVDIEQLQEVYEEIEVEE